MRPDIDAGPIGRKWRESKGPPPGMAALAVADCDCATRLPSELGPNAAPSAASRMRTRTDFMADSRGMFRRGRLWHAAGDQVRKDMCEDKKTKDERRKTKDKKTRLLVCLSLVPC